MKKSRLTMLGLAGSAAVALLPLDGARAAQYHIAGGGLQGVAVTEVAFTTGGCQGSFVGSPQDGIDAKILPIPPGARSVTINWTSAVPNGVGGILAKFFVGCSPRPPASTEKQGAWVVAVPGGANWVAVESSVKAVIDFDMGVTF